MIGAMKLQPDDGPRSNLSIGPGFGRCSGISLKFARRFVEGIGKLVGNISGDYRQKIERLTVRMSKADGLAGYFGRLTRLGPIGRSYIPVFQIRIEKMKEVKRPPL
ncbi:hypothetical protein B296_00011355 [Ensete ventricosum]|uniref:Uncharacterized protein n=1 Tax=Ensete ventricosum TaxID=4639 RepID=A0A426Z6J4_ENSVE|nr:hypothetical protein B296_00011355 [Ensete ventricosum]